MLQQKSSHSNSVQAVAVRHSRGSVLDDQSQQLTAPLVQSIAACKHAREDGNSQALPARSEKENRPTLASLTAVLAAIDRSDELDPR